MEYAELIWDFRFKIKFEYNLKIRYDIKNISNIL